MWSREEKVCPAHSRFPRPKAELSWRRLCKVRTRDTPAPSPFFLVHPVRSARGGRLRQFRLDQYESDRALQHPLPGVGDELRVVIWAGWGHRHPVGFRVEGLHLERRERVDLDRHHLELSRAGRRDGDVPGCRECGSRPAAVLHRRRRASGRALPAGGPVPVRRVLLRCRPGPGRRRRQDHRRAHACRVRLDDGEPGAMGNGHAGLRAR